MSDLSKEILANADISVEGLSKEGLENMQNKVEEISNEWEHLGITSDFIFCKVMQDKELLSGLIKMILPDIEIGDLDITAQKSVELGKDIHGVRFDIYVKSNDGTVIQIEMQVLNQGNLPRRLRYYGSMCDADMLEKSVVYSKLKDSYIIAICPFDYYEKGLHKYTFTNRCHEVDNLEMSDGTTKIVLNAVGTADDVHGSLKEFLDYVAGKQSDDEYVKK
ncbi:MAG: Rpn family recombination-promoting nuclease/putative transposase [Lachnospiraceae bacterium]|nr:Rpn family recombination-promoting nuclease/putative transposase [Lachnospiraceae bacterium]